MERNVLKHLINNCFLGATDIQNYFLYCHRVSKSFLTRRNTPKSHIRSLRNSFWMQTTTQITKIHPGTDLKCIPGPTELTKIPRTSPSQSYAQAWRILEPKVNHLTTFDPQPPSPTTLIKTSLYTQIYILPSSIGPHAGRPE